MLKWIGHLRMKANECGFKEKDRKLKEQFINDISDDDIMTEIIKELIATKKINEITGDKLLSCVRTAEAQRAWKTFIEATKDHKEFNAIKEHEQNNNTKDRREKHNNCKYCGSICEPRSCPACGKSFPRCGSMNHFKWVCKSQS